MHRPLLLGFALLLCCFVAAACGGGDDGDVDVDKVLQQTFGEDKNIKSGRLDLSLRLDAQGLAQLQGPVTAKLSGPFASTGDDQLPRFGLEAELTAGGQTLRAGATSTGDKGFVSFQGQAYAISDELFEQFRQGYAEEARKNKGDEGVSFRSLGIDPRRWLRDPEYDGKEEVGGAESLHIRAGIDVPRLLEDVNKILGRAEQIQGQQARQLTEEERRQLEEAVKDADIELWTGEDDKIMRRLNVRLDFEVPEENRDRANGLSSGVLRFDFGLGAINDEQEIRAPENPKPFEDLLAALGRSGQAQPGQGSTEPAPAPGSGGAQTPYEKCVEEAGADISKLQECAGLAGG